MDFNDFVTMLRVSSVDSLDMYDDRLGSVHGLPSVEQLNAMLQRTKSIGSMDSRYGGLMDDMSQHSDVRTNQSQHFGGVFDQDFSMHGSSSMHGGSSHNGSKPSNAVAFRFEVTPQKPAAPPAAAVVAEGSPSGPASAFFRFDNGPQAPSSPVNRGPAAVGPASNFFRFDVAGPAPKPSPPQNSFFRFEVAGPGSSKAPPPPPAAAQPAAPAETGGGMSQGLGLLRNSGGHFDRRHHGSGLYQAMVGCRTGAAPGLLGARMLETVQE